MTRMPATVTLKVRVTADVKQRFEALAKQREISVSDLLRRLIDDLLARLDAAPSLAEIARLQGEAIPIVDAKWPIAVTGCPA